MAHGEELGGVEGTETATRMYYVRKTPKLYSTFSYMCVCMHVYVCVLRTPEEGAWPFSVELESQVL